MRLDAIDLRRLSALSASDRAFLTVYYSGASGWEKERKRLLQDRALLKSWPDELEHFDQNFALLEAELEKLPQRNRNVLAFVCFRLAVLFAFPSG